MARSICVVLNRIDQLVYSLKPVKAKGKKITMHRNNLKRYIARELATNTTTEIDTQTQQRHKQFNQQTLRHRQSNAYQSLRKKQHQHHHHHHHHRH
jgi:hypothetical protein